MAVRLEPSASAKGVHRMTDQKLTQLRVSEVTSFHSQGGLLDVRQVAGRKNNCRIFITKSH
jgi:hypothetical protein